MIPPEVNLVYKILGELAHCWHTKTSEVLQRNLRTTCNLRRNSLQAAINIQQKSSIVADSVIGIFTRVFPQIVEIPQSAQRLSAS